MLYLSWLWYSLVLFARQETHSDTFDGRDASAAVGGAGAALQQWTDGEIMIEKSAINDRNLRLLDYFCEKSAAKNKRRTTRHQRFEPDSV